MPNITPTTGGVFIPEIWINEVRAALETALVMTSKFKHINFEGMKGDTAHIPDISDLAANDMQASGAVTPQAITEGEFLLQVQQWKESSFLISDLIKVQGQYDLRTEYTKKAGFAIAKAIETYLATKLGDTSFAEFDGDGTAATANGAAITIAGILKAFETLDNNNVPETGRNIFVAPSSRNVMLQIPQFVSIDYVDTKPTVTKKIGELFGVPVLTSNLVPSTVKTATSRINALVAHSDAVALAIQMKARVQAEYILEKLGWLFVADSVFDAGVFRSESLVKLRMNVNV